MRVLTGSGKTNYPDIQIESGVQRLFFCFTFVTATFAAAFANVRASVKMYSKNRGTESIINDLPIADLLEIAASNEGFVKQSINGTNTIIKGTIELSNIGAVETKDGYLSLSITNMLDTDTVNVNTLDSAIVTNSFVSYEQVFVNANSQKDIDNSGAYGIAIPVTVTNIDFCYPGRTVTNNAEELAQETSENNELCYLTEANEGAGALVIPGSKKFFCIGVNDVKSFRITLSEAGNVYLMKNKVL